MPPITPVTEDEDEQTQPRLTIDPQITAPDGSFYVFDGEHGYRRVVEPWAVEAHIGPIRASEKLGDVDSWAAYVLRYAGADDHAPLLTWSEAGLRAVLDYHTAELDAGRCQWTAAHPFERSDRWKAWARLADGQPRSQKQAIEALEDLAEDIKEPAAGDVVGILRKLRASVNASAETELQPDGSTSVSFKKDTKVQSGAVSLPPEIAIQIPVLKGHTEQREGKAVPVLYRLSVRVRPSIDDQARLTFRFSMPTAERVMEAVYLDRVEAARLALGDELSILRATA
jgi:hypothetical protein